MVKIIRKRIPARKIAIENGDKYYIGNPCLRGHDGKRYTKGGNCYECNALRSASRSNIYNDSEKWKAYKRSDKWKAYQKKYQLMYRNNPANKDKLLEIARRFNIKHNYNGDERAYLAATEKRADRRAEINAETAERDLIRKNKQNDK